MTKEVRERAKEQEAYRSHDREDTQITLLTVDMRESRTETAKAVPQAKG